MIGFGILSTRFPLLGSAARYLFGDRLLMTISSDTLLKTY